MRYWGPEETVTKTGHRPMPARRRNPARSGAAKPSVSPRSRGSAKNSPFLRRFYSHQAQISGRVQRIVLLLILAGLVYAFVLGDSGAVQIVMLRHERSALDERIAELRRNSEIIATEISRLETDDFYIEKLGREKFGYVRPDETVYKFVPLEKKTP